MRITIRYPPIIKILGLYTEAQKWTKFSKIVPLLMSGLSISQSDRTKIGGSFEKENISWNSMPAGYISRFNQTTPPFKTLTFLTKNKGIWGRMIRGTAGGTTKVVLALRRASFYFGLFQSLFNQSGVWNAKF